MNVRHTWSTWIQLAAAAVQGVYLVLFALNEAGGLGAALVALELGVAFPFAIAGVIVCARAPRDFPGFTVWLLWGLAPAVSLAGLYHLRLVQIVFVVIPPVPWCGFTMYLVAMVVVGVVVIANDPAWRGRAGKLGDPVSE